MAVKRIYVEKKPDFAVEANGILSDIQTALMLGGVTRLRLFNRYDAQGLSDEDFAQVRDTVFSEPPVDVTYDVLPDPEGARVFASEYLPGQFDQRADSCAQCIQISTLKDKPLIRTARVYYVYGEMTNQQFEAVKHYLINPVESREASLELPETLEASYSIPTEVKTLDGFTAYSREELREFIASYGLAMDEDDIAFCQSYFRDEERRDPTITEIRMIDTYWSDHCRHTTFGTIIDQVEIEPPYIRDSYQKYLALRAKLGREGKPICLMDLATIGAKALKAEGYLQDLDESEEINACSVRITVDNDGRESQWLLMFKNETHNHPTEIEPFGGAATCLGGAIRDPLSGRSYVYQAMRVTGAADPLLPVEQTMKGKLPQRKLVTTAAGGYSSYGNQIGLATGHVAELYHPGYAAKRLEIGAVIAAAPVENVVRQRPEPSDVVILLGGRTGRDGCGGATGSSKSHTLESLETCGAEVQKGNAPEERKLQRLFRDGNVTRMIKRCNDFGAGGVSVAIGELADGLEIDLNAVPKKYEGLDGTELAISESQERMAVVVAEKDAAAFIQAANRENLEATRVAVVTEKPRLVLNWNGKSIVNLSREFLNSNGAEKHTTASIPAPVQQIPEEGKPKSLKKKLLEHLSDLNLCSQKGLVERFDSTIGANTLLMPFGGRHQLTPAQAMAAKIPMLQGDTTTCSLMGWGFNPFLSQYSPYHGAMLAVVESVAKIVAAGGSYHKCWLTFQEYFERTNNRPERWGKPLSALLGALEAQLALKCGAIGGKDSMSGTFEDIDVPPTLVSFAVSAAKTGNIISTEFKRAGHPVYLIKPHYNQDGLPCFESVRAVFDEMEKLIASGRVKAVWTLSMGGVMEAVTKMGFGNRIGFRFGQAISENELYCSDQSYGGFVFETEEPVETTGSLLGHTVEEYSISMGGETVSMDEIQKAWEAKLQPVFPYLLPTPRIAVPTFSYERGEILKAGTKHPQPRVLIPVFPGTNCEYDTARAFELAGAKAEIFVVRNLTSGDLEESVAAFEKKIGESQIIAIPGGFSGGDEPDGSGKFITAFFRNPRIVQAVHGLLRQRDGLMCGICNGFQALIKLGLVPYGEIRAMDESCPTLTFNRIGRHQSNLVRLRVASNKSPWLMFSNVGDVYTVPISHGEGRFVADDGCIARLAAGGQIATQYVNLEGRPSLDIRFNPNESAAAIEGITSPDGRVFGKMGHSERIGDRVYLNVDGEKDMKLFRGAVEYFR